MDTEKHSPKKDASGLQSYKGANMTPIEATKAATILIGQFLNSSRGDEIFLTSLASLLGTFSRSVVEDCVNPRIGYAITAQFLSLQKVNDWCNDRAERYSLVIAQQKRMAEQISNRENPKPIRTERGMAMAREWLARCGSYDEKQSAKARARLIAEFGQDAFDAVPDQPTSFRHLPDRFT